jgi:alkanesulfonate monooxygenase SsuD/methylene tetrahydromethanopterin reductase-like flavin-dependent oxidoreductase (luciferase family)
MPFFVGSDDWVAQRNVAQAVDELGYDSLWSGDHPSLGSDCWTTLAAYAVLTRRVRLGSMVNCAYYRSPWLLACQVIDVDRASGGRAILGVGAGWLANEFALLRVPFPSAVDRVKYLTETVHELQRIFGSEPLENIFIATPEQVAVAGLARLAPQRPRIPIVVGGSGEKVILRLVAECSDVCSVESGKAQSPEEVAHKFEIARAYCQKRGRAPDSLIHSHYLNVFAFGESESELSNEIARLPAVLRPAAVRGRTAFTLRGVIEYYRSIVAAGANYLIFAPFSSHERTVRLFAERVMPELQDSLREV